ncbi:MAG: hypothetical protein QW587_02875 [Candidatus Bathyarchaeia archaeon]
MRLRSYAVYDAELLCYLKPRLPPRRRIRTGEAPTGRRRLGGSQPGLGVIEAAAIASTEGERSSKPSVLGFPVKPST